jgi:preprotein translocase subunit SecD
VRRSLVWSLVGIIFVAVAALAATIAVGNTPLLGLDLRGGVSVVLQPQGTVDNATLSQAVTIIERRVNGLGVANSNVQRQGKDVVVELPGIKDSQNALRVLGTTATLYFRPLYCAIPAYSPPKATSPTTTAPPASAPKAAGVPGGAAAVHLADAVRPAAANSPTPPAATTPTTTPSAPATTAPPATAPSSTGSASTPTGPGGVSEASCQASNAAQLPTTSPDQETAGQPAVVTAAPGSGLPGNERFIVGPADLTGSGVSTAGVSTDQTGAYVVDLTFNAKGAAAFNKMAAQRYPYYQKNASQVDPRSQEAIELDGQLESAPTIQTDNFGNQAQISGAFTATQANNLALVLRYGSLPVRFTPQSVQTVSASIGSDSLRAGLLAGLGGIVLVMLYMILYYRALGLVVLLGLGVGGALLYSIITELSQTASLALTLSGVTGIIVSVGITVDSYVVYFERLKDEVRAGRSIRQSTERSFHRAFRTVLTADFVSFLAAAVLYFLTVGDVKGFAFTLGLSTLLDVVTAYFFIRPMVILVGRRRTFTENRVLGVARGLGADSARSTTGVGV